MVQIDIVVKCAGEDTMGYIAKTSFFASEPVRLSDIQEAFPFRGKFHFRYKFSREACRKYKGFDIDEEYVWLDLVSAADAIPFSPQQQAAIEVQALVRVFGTIILYFLWSPADAIFRLSF